MIQKTISQSSRTILLVGDFQVEKHQSPILQSLETISVLTGAHMQWIIAVDKEHMKYDAESKEEV